MRIISQDKKSDVLYEEGSLEVEGVRIFCYSGGHKFYLGAYINDNGDDETLIKVLQMIRQSEKNGEKEFYMPQSSDVQ